MAPGPWQKRSRMVKPILCGLRIGVVTGMSGCTDKMPPVVDGPTYLSHLRKDWLQQKDTMMKIAASLADVRDSQYFASATRARIVWSLLGHAMHIHGQMAMYLRLNGIVPFASHGI